MREKTITRTAKTEVGRAILQKPFFMAVLGFVVVFLCISFAPFVKTLREGANIAYGAHLSELINRLEEDAILMFLPVLSAVPYTVSFVDDVKTGFIKPYMIRAEKKSYIYGKILACLLSGGLAMAIGVILSFLCTALLYAPMELPPQEGEQLAPLFAQLLQKLLLFFCAGSFWAMTGMLFSAWTNSRYMAYAAPFIFYYVLIILCERYFANMKILYPKEWLVPSVGWPLGNIGVIIFLCCFTAWMILLFISVARRRIADV
ncbi:MAG: hypothetical protein ACOX3W_10470 [Christensenellaceae bacterium]|jgi:hypothetical protein